MILRCNRDLAKWFGAIDAQTVDQYRELKRAWRAGEYILVRDIEGQGMFWPIATGLTALMRQMK